MQPGQIEIRLRWTRQLADIERRKLNEFLWAYGIDPWMLKPERVDEVEDYGQVNVVTQRRPLADDVSRSPWGTMIDRNRALQAEVDELKARLAGGSGDAPSLGGDKA